MQRVFVYGTLRKDNYLHMLLAYTEEPEQAVLEDYAMEYRNVGTTAIPRIYPKKGSKVVGEIYHIFNEYEIDVVERGYIKKFSKELNAYFYAVDKPSDAFTEAPSKDSVYDFNLIKAS